MGETLPRQDVQIIGVIDDRVPDQPACLNAGVEAARQAKLAVVSRLSPSEVRTGPASSDAKEIKTLTLQQAESGVELVNKTGALQKITAEGCRDFAQNGNLRLTQEQSSGLAQVNTAVNQMDQVTSRTPRWWKSPRLLRIHWRRKRAFRTC